MMSPNKSMSSRAEIELEHIACMGIPVMTKGNLVNCSYSKT